MDEGDAQGAQRASTRRMLTVPNAISALRIALIPVFVSLILDPDTATRVIRCLTPNHAEFASASTRLDSALSALMTLTYSLGSASGCFPNSVNFLATAVDPAKLVLRLLCDQKKRERVVEAARQWAAEHDAAWSAGQYAKLYEELLR